MVTINKDRKISITVSIVWIVILSIGVLLQNLPISPLYQYLESDSGVYAYMGSAIINGQLPYRDVWEHKPPIGFYLNAIALLLFGHTPWAIWWFNVFWVSLTCMIFFLLIKKMMGLITGCLASLLLSVAVMQPSIFQGGNLMEVYGLLFQVLAIGAAFYFFLTARNRWGFILGVTTSLAFLTKQTTIALGLSSLFAIFLISLLRRHFRQAFLRLLIFAGGLIGPILLVSIYWIINGAAYDFVDAVFLHSLTYVADRTPSFWMFRYELKRTLLTVFPQLYISRLYYISIGAFVLYLFEKRRGYFALLKHGKNGPPNEINPTELTMLAIFIALPVEIVFASLGGRDFGHYFLTLVPAGATVIAYVVYKTVHGFRSSTTIRFNISPLTAGWMFLSLASLWWVLTAARSVLPTASQLATITKVFSNQYELAETEKFIVANTEPNDKVLIWHVHVGTNFVTNTKAGSKVLFPMNIFVPDKQGFDKLDDFISEFENDPPKLILIQKPNSAGLPFVDGNLDEMCKTGCLVEVETALKTPGVYAKLEELKRFFDTNYFLDKQIYDWYIYKLKK